MRVSLEGRMAMAGWRKARAAVVLRYALLALMALLLLALLSGTARYLSFRPQEGATGAMRVHWPIWRSFLMSLGAWAALVPALFLLAGLVRRTPLRRGHWKAVLVRHGVGILLYVPAQFALSWTVYAGLCALTGSWGETREILDQMPQGAYWASLIGNAFQYFGSVSLLYAGTYVLREWDKERQLAHAQLRMLRMQLNPHFLFNALNSVTALLRRDPDGAERMILSLTDFLRSTLEEGGGLETPFGRELEIARRYFEIESVRFPGRLTLEVQAEPPLMEALVPAFLLQPLVENAVRHGLAPRATGGKVTVRAWAEGKAFCLAVEDDGLGAQAPRKGGLGVGLANTRERLLHLYGPEATLSAGPGPEGGFHVAMRLPLHFAEGPETGK